MLIVLFLLRKKRNISLSSSSSFCLVSSSCCPSFSFSLTTPINIMKILKPVRFPSTDARKIKVFWSLTKVICIVYWRDQKIVAPHSPFNLSFSCFNSFWSLATSLSLSRSFSSFLARSCFCASSVFFKSDKRDEKYLLLRLRKQSEVPSLRNTIY